MKNNDPFEPWNGFNKDDPFAPWNDPMKKDDPFGHGSYKSDADNY